MITPGFLVLLVGGLLFMGALLWYQNKVGGEENWGQLNLRDLFRIRQVAVSMFFGMMVFCLGLWMMTL